MSKLLGFAAGAAAIVGATVIASLVLNAISVAYIVSNKHHDVHHTTAAPPPHSSPVPPAPLSSTSEPHPRTHQPEPTGQPGPTDQPGPTGEPGPTNPPEPITHSESTHHYDPTYQPASSSPTSPPSGNNTVFCPNVGNAIMNKGWKDAAAYLLFGIDERFDPCEDLYSFTCNKFVEQINLDDLDVSRFSSFDMAQLLVNGEIVQALNSVNISDEKFSATERITKAVLSSCVDHFVSEERSTSALYLLEFIKERFGAIPFLNHTIEDPLQEFENMAYLERERALGTFMSSWVAVDYKNVSQNVLYLSQPALPMPREYYVLPQFSNELEARAKAIENIMKTFASDILDDSRIYNDMIVEAAREVAKLEQRIAMASWPESEMRNYGQLYNSLTPKMLGANFPNIMWVTYLENLLSSVGGYTAVGHRVIVSQPSYFGFLVSLFGGRGPKTSTLINYFITQLLFEDADFFGGDYQEIAKGIGYVPYAQRRGFGVTRIGRQFGRRFDDESDAHNKCLDILMTYMPYGPGYVYAKSRRDRDEAVKDAKLQSELVMKYFLEKMLSSLEWAQGETYQKAKTKIDEMHTNYGWPTQLFGDFQNFEAIDKYHEEDYSPILEAYKNDTFDFYTIMNILRKGLVNREAFRNLLLNADRANFLMSPALVNAWYQPERNSLTIPLGILNPPFHNLTFPSAFNFAGIGGTIGHELVHGFDDEGVQFDADGSLDNCTPFECGWMDDRAKMGFRNMAQCVVTQYNTQCCPEKLGNVHCANGAATQGENIADLGGQQAAYYAYQEYINGAHGKDDRLPGMEKFTGDQIFWISYGSSWCSKQTDSRLIKQILTNPHAPSSCRTNQVVQDIPEFAEAFHCTLGQKMYPTPEKRCKVWVG